MAMVMNDSSVRDSLIDGIWYFAARNQSQSIFPTNFELDGKGTALGNVARYSASFPRISTKRLLKLSFSPGVGGVFAGLGLSAVMGSV